MTPVEGGATDVAPTPAEAPAPPAAPEA
jgi:hypothetical protein